MDYRQAKFILGVVVASCALLITVFGLVAVFRSRRRGRVSVAPVLLAAGIWIFSAALTHVLLGSVLEGRERRSLWAEGTLFAIPTSLAALGGTFVSIWAVLWTAEASLWVTRSKTGELRRRQAAKLVYLFNGLGTHFRGILQEWFAAATDGGMVLEELIRETWEELLDKVQDDRLLGGDGCARGHTVCLPEVNVFLPGEEYGSLELGCSHFQSVLSGKLPRLYGKARQLAVNKKVSLSHVREVADELASLLREFGFDAKRMLKDVEVLSHIYPPELPDPSTQEGRYHLALILDWVHWIHSDRGWIEGYRARAESLGVNVIERINEPREEKMREDWDLARTASVARGRLRDALLRRISASEVNLASESEIDFWGGLAREAGHTESPPVFPNASRGRPDDLGDQNS